MARSTRPFVSNRIVVDTGVLLTVLVLNFVRLMQVPRQKQQQIFDRGIATYLRNDPNLRRGYLARFSREIRPLRTTPYVIAEINGLAKSRLQLYSHDLRSFWRHSIDFLLAKDLDESLVRLIDLKDLSEVVCEIGPTDAAIIHLAHKEGGVLLTTDGRLLGRAREQSVIAMSEYEFAHGAAIPQWTR